MLEDLRLMQVVETFLKENISRDYVDNVYRYSPPSDAADPFIIVGILGSDETRTEIDGGNEYSANIQVSILTTNYDFGTPELRESIERLYTATHHVRIALESSNYLEYVRGQLGAMGSTLRVDNFVRSFGVSTAGASQHLSCTITTPFIIFQQKLPLIG